MALRRLLSPFVAAALADLAAADYTYYCQFACSGKLNDQCVEKECPAPSSGCVLNGLQPFVDSEVCEEYKQSQPQCDPAVQQCSEAADFQLVYDRTQDFHRTFSGLDWQGVARMFHDEAAVFVPGSSKFAFQTDIADAAEKFYQRTKVSMKLMVSHALTTNGSHVSDTRVVHGLGNWQVQDETNAPLMQYYVRFIQKLDVQHWVAESLVVGLSSGQTASMQGSERQLLKDGPLWSEISRRNDELTKLYNSKNYSGVAALYGKEAALIPRDGKPVSGGGIKAFYETAPLGSSAKLYPTILAQAPGSNALHQIGYSDSTRSGFMARWTQEDGQWVIETHLYAVFSEDSQTEILV